MPNIYEQKFTICARLYILAVRFYIEIFLPDSNNLKVFLSKKKKVK